jgi:hypothetical protein
MLDIIKRKTSTTKPPKKLSLTQPLIGLQAGEADGELIVV